MRVSSSSESPPIRLANAVRPVGLLGHVDAIPTVTVRIP